jgi:penicillin-binding protein-related factor A (putative recombinase)
MLEKDIVNAITRYLKTVPECFFFKAHGGMYGTAGLPDIICCYRGRFVAFEVKTETGKLTTLQESTLKRINAAKGNAYKVTTLQEVKEILQNLNS